jgi:hypothetical protein
MKLSRQAATFHLSMAAAGPARWDGSYRPCLKAVLKKYRTLARK